VSDGRLPTRSRPFFFLDRETVSADPKTLKERGRADAKS
jgi:hypothetical protein